MHLSLHSNDIKTWDNRPTPKQYYHITQVYSCITYHYCVGPINILWGITQQEGAFDNKIHVTSVRYYWCIRINFSSKTQYGNFCVEMRVNMSVKFKSAFFFVSMSFHLLYCGQVTLNGSIGNRDHSRFAPSQWETALLCNHVSHWLGTSQVSSLVRYDNWRDEGNRSHIMGIVLQKYSDFRKGVNYWCITERELEFYI